MVSLNLMGWPCFSSSVYMRPAFWADVSSIFRMVSLLSSVLVEARFFSCFFGFVGAVE